MEVEDTSLCLIHLEGTGGPLTRFSRNSLSTFLRFRECWLNVDGKQTDTAQTSLEKLSREDCERIIENEEDESEVPFYYHRTCYSRFTDKAKLKAAQIRKEKSLAAVAADITGETAQSHHDSDVLHVLPQKRTRASATKTCPVIAPRNRFILPPVCIICEKENITKTEKRTGKRHIVPLINAETVDGGLLREAAQRKNDERILLKIRDQDCVAIEVKYHRQCYNSYVRFLHKREREQATQIYTISFQKLCTELIEEKILKLDKIYHMQQIFANFVNIVHETEGLDASNYKASRLKARLQDAYPQLVFLDLPRRNHSEVVFCEKFTSGNKFKESLSNLVEPDEDEDSDFEIEVEQSQQRHNDNALKDLYLSALQLRQVIKECPDFATNWPPTSINFTPEKTKEFVPIPLFNFLAWVLCKSDVPSLEEFVSVDDSDYVKLLSIAQDIIYNTHGGKKQTPKSMALSMTVRQMTGSGKVIDILNRLGHCSSHSSTLRHDTALAEISLGASSIVPRDAVPSVWTTIVADNADFGEEAKMQTHITNMIMIQRDETQKENEVPEVNTKRSGRKSIKAPPSDIGNYSLGKKKSPSFRDVSTHISLSKASHDLPVQNSKRDDQVYAVVKQQGPVGQSLLPDWTGFNTLLQPKPTVCSKISYLPIIDASPTEYATIKKILDSCCQIALELQLSQIALVCDEAVYAKVQQVRWKSPDFMEKVIVRLGDFHVSMSFMATIAKRFKDAGLKDILVEAEVVGPGTVNSVMTGKHYNRSVYCHKIMFEALERLRFQAFYESLTPSEQDEITLLITDVREKFPDEDFVNCMSSETLLELFKRYERFVDTWNAKDPTFALWSSYISMTGLLMSYIKATRTSDWKLHLASVRSMLPWMFAYDRVNYSRYLSTYWLELSTLDQTHPGSAEQLEKNWTVQRQTSYGFSSIACDQVIEQTANRDAKTAGGIIGNTLNRGAVHRWLLSQSERTAIARQCQVMAGSSHQTRRRKNLDKTFCKRHETDVQNVLSIIGNMINPFGGTSSSLTNIASGVMAGKDIEADMMRAEELGDSLFQKFAEEKLFSAEGDIFSTIKRNNLKTFGSLVQKPKSSKKLHQVSVESSRNFFARLILLANSREIDMREVLSYSLGNFPLSIASADGGMAKTMKSKLLHVVTSSVESSECQEIPKGGSLILDAMAIIQATKNTAENFGEYAKILFDQLIALSSYYEAKRIDFVADRYFNQSIKGSERAKRGNSTGVQLITIYNDHQRCPKQWKKILSSGENKESLISYLVSVWKKYPSHWFRDKKIYVTFEEHCLLLYPTEDSVVASRDVPELRSDQEEADTRMLLHAKHASMTNESVVVKSPDTDVFALAVSVKREIQCDLYFDTGTQSNRRILDINEIASQLGDGVCRALPGFHAFTGCDSTSAFRGRSKLQAWKVFIDDEASLDAFMALGNNIEVEENVLAKLEVYTCKLYRKAACDKVDEARFQLFRQGKFSDDKLPPNSDCLKKHILRCNYQTYIWKHCLQPIIGVPSPVGNGWKEEDDLLHIDWMDQEPAPASLLEFIYCSCKGKCSSNRCSCQKNSLKCTNLCQCRNCENSRGDNGGDDQEEDDDDDDDDDENDENVVDDADSEVEGI